MSDALAERYKAEMERGVKYSGIMNVIMIDPVESKAMMLLGHKSTPMRDRWTEVIGAGRLMSRGVLDVVDGRPWPDKLSRGADWRMTVNLQRHGVAGVDSRIKTGGDAWMMDVKGAGNLWPYEKVDRQANSEIIEPLDYEEVLMLLPEKELAIIRKLEGAKCHHCGQRMPL